MRFWWVNHSQTFKAELAGGYLWSPTTKKNGGFNQGYKNLTLTRGGDLVFSFADGVIKAVGIVKIDCAESLVPKEFGSKGDQWNKDGYLVKVEWDHLQHPLKVKLHIEDFKDLLPIKYSPIRQTGDGNQGIYLAEITKSLSDKLVDVINKENNFVKPDIEGLVKIVEENEEKEKIENSSLSPTEKEQLIKSRRGQGKFRTKLIKIEKACRITKISDTAFLTASHIKPWCKSSNLEKLDGNNGLLLSPHIDRLFDQGWMSFEDNGDIIFAKAIPSNLIKNWGITITNVGPFNSKQIIYLDYHRKNKFKDNK